MDVEKPNFEGLTEVQTLNEDPHIEGQTYFLISVIGPAVSPKHECWGMKVRGVYNTEEECIAACLKLQTIDPNMNVFRWNIGKWFGLNTSMKQMNENTRYLLDPVLERIMTGSRKQQIAAAERVAQMQAEERRRDRDEMIEEDGTDNPRDTKITHLA